MVPLKAVYVRMNELLEQLGVVADRLYKDVGGLDERLSGLGIAWEGTAYEQYSVRLKSDMEYMKAKAANMKVMHSVLTLSLAGYQQTEMKVNGVIGGMKR